MDASTDFVASSFDAAAREISPTPILRSEPWETMPEVARDAGAKLIMGIFPAFLGVDLRFHRALRSLGVPVCTYPTEQLKIAAAMAEHLDVGAIVTMATSVEALVKEMATRSAHVAYRAVLAPGELPQFHSDNLLYEVHVLPGVVGLFQCPNHRTIFHASRRFAWRLGEEHLQAHDEHGFFSRMMLPYRATAAAAHCSCAAALSVQLS